MTDQQTDLNVFQQALADSVHFSLKTINSNIEKGGLRLATTQQIDLPYISARTLLSDGIVIPTDYQANAGKTATVFKVVKAAQLNEDLSSAEEDFKQQVTALKSELATAFTHPFSAGLAHINVRMRQLLIPKDGQYISISPLTAAGLNHVLNIEVDALKEQRKTAAKDTHLKNIQTAVFGIGGSNAQNVGSLVRAMQRPIVVSSPPSNTQSRLAFQYFYKGFDYGISNAYINPVIYTELSEYAEKLKLQIQLTTELGFNTLGIAGPFSNMQQRADEMGLIEKIVQNVLEQGQTIYLALKAHEKELPSLKTLERNSFWSHPSVSIITQGLINTEIQQFDDWKLSFSLDLAKRITQHRYWKKYARNQEEQQIISVTGEKNITLLSRRILELLA